MASFVRNDTGDYGRAEAFGAPVNVARDPFWSRAASKPVGRECSVQDVDADGASEVVSVAVASGGRTTESVQSVFQLDGFNPVVMHQAVSRDATLGTDQVVLRGGI